MILNKANLERAAKSFRALYYEALEKLPDPIYKLLAMVVPSSAQEESYNWLGESPLLKEWFDERQIERLKAYDYTVRNKDWEATIAVGRNDILFDKLGLVRPRSEGLAAEGPRHYERLILALFLTGFDTVCYDGQYFFDSDHPNDSEGTQSNVTDAVLAADAYAAAYAAMMSLKSHKGEPLGVQPTHLAVPPQLRSTGLEILKAERLADGATNVNKDSAELIVVPEWSGHATKWGLFDLSKPVKPFILQVVKEAEFAALDMPTDENVFMRKEFLFGIDTIDNAGFGLWELGYGSTGDAS